MKYNWKEYPEWYWLHHTFGDSFYRLKDHGGKVFHVHHEIITTVIDTWQLGSRKGGNRRKTSIIRMINKCRNYETKSVFGKGTLAKSKETLGIASVHDLNMPDTKRNHVSWVFRIEYVFLCYILQMSDSWLINTDDPILHTFTNTRFAILLGILWLLSTHLTNILRVAPLEFGNGQVRSSHAGIKVDPW